MLGFLTGKIKTYLLGALAMLMPILYVIGRRDEKKIQKSLALEDALQAEKKKADFYMDMEKSNNEIENSKPADRSAIVDRLRNSGL